MLTAPALTGGGFNQHQPQMTYQQMSSTALTELIKLGEKLANPEADPNRTVYEAFKEEVIGMGIYHYITDEEGEWSEELEFDEFFEEIRSIVDFLCKEYSLSSEIQCFFHDAGINMECANEVAKEVFFCPPVFNKDGEVMNLATASKSY